MLARMAEEPHLLDSYKEGLIGLPVSHVWRGHGSAIFLEFGELTPTTRPRGTPGNPEGQFGLMIQWSWRIEGPSTILCGSWSDEALWEPTFQQVLGQRVVGLSAFARLPEIAVALSGDLHVASFMTSDGDPDWALFDRRGSAVRTIHSRNAEVLEETK
jgi:hypothetical protein